MHSWHYLIDLWIGLLVVFLDRVTKYLAIQTLIPNLPMKVGSIFGIEASWTLMFNTGAAWGIFNSFSLGLLFLRLIFLGFLFWIYLTSKMPPSYCAALALILGGAISNIVDTIMWGYVVDMIHLRLWGWDYPVFNVADSAICIGAILMIVKIISKRQKAEW